VEPGDDLVLVPEAEAIRVLTPQEGIKRAQAIIRPYIPDDGSLLSDELIAERRQESEESDLK
jgi:hypothetical protein